uniref:MPL proto-onco, thrombopoietin receptor n=1 Tax=Sphenodon punctatus TaxID=8508 RepID=A0A8D0GIB7_SPHPU
MAPRLCPEQTLPLQQRILIALLLPTLSLSQVTDEGLIAAPQNIRAVWPGAAQQLQVTWEPPAIGYAELCAYQLLYGIAASRDPPSMVLVAKGCMCLLKDLLPGQQYQIRVRSKPDGTSFDGLWGPWSRAVLAETPHLPDEIRLRCFTPDLRWLRCTWSWEPAEPNANHSLLYWAQSSSGAGRGLAWQRCEQEGESHPGAHVCMFQPRNDSCVSVRVTVTRGLQPELTYFQEPFSLYQAVLTGPPRILRTALESWRLQLQWAPPLEELEEHMVYEIRYSGETSPPDWKVLQVQRAANSQALDLHAGTRYRLQVRTKPNGQRYQGFWSAWSEEVAVETPLGADWTVLLSILVSLLLCAGFLLGLGCTFPSAYSSVKQRLWPPLPDLHRALGGFLTDSSKQQQQQQTAAAGALFYSKPLEDVLLPCLLEVLSETLPEAARLDPLPAAAAAAEKGSLASPQQDYMVLQPSRNESLATAGEGDDALALSLLFHGSDHLVLGPQTHDGPFPPLPSTLPSAPSPAQQEQEGWECSASPTHISNQSYLLIG